MTAHFSHPARPALKLTEPIQVNTTEAPPSPREDFLVFGKPVIGPEEMAEVQAVLESGWLGTGPRVAAFEQSFAAYKGLDDEQAVGVNSCTAALHLALKLSGIGPGDEVITTPLTFCATVNAILHVGATPVLADVDPVTQNLDPAAVAAAITPRTAAILPVHFAGRPCDMTALVTLADRHGLEIIEDCAHAIETTYHGKPAGTFGRFAAFSFYATKNVTTGEGGMLLCRDPQDASRARTLSLHGLSRDAYTRFRQAPDGSPHFRHYQMVEPGFKYNLTDLAAALGLHQLSRVETNLERRSLVWKNYNDMLAGVPLNLPSESDSDETHARHLYTVHVGDDADRDPLLDFLLQQNIGIGVHYLSVAEHPWYQTSLGWSPDAQPQARDLGRRTLSLPLTAGLTERDLRDVVSVVKEFFDERPDLLLE
ncbi:DegT/DnrJ/EryC1/StrS family aminotransferase [Algisphaera agarilytica]|uniref:dTDP-4-amino-4,6-dideoxygalactose transaminase n=1 Tax=Algisphaera agarilytica TaxID=1385975 RepID=A0A7X0H496_9BACT|nr:DegT/DnrJ/EryC1/StrS family aminotransferase [Algisphaera agarilytica]MBB6428996.1 dTDP-4-amino-4,6-dideoxygalactose transaminase [Algisphaera agarilytica]